jgi:PncC family amidohydrolase
VPGSSAYYLGGFVTYANEIKETHVGVRRETLLAHGAVSEETALEMAQGARKRMGGDVALSVTGIAGPDGGTVEKPVGLVYIALAAEDMERCERHVWPRVHDEKDELGSNGGPTTKSDRSERVANKELSAEAALQLLLTYLQERGK